MGSECRRTCILCQQISRKKLVWKHECDVTNSEHQIQMTTICHWMKPPHENFLHTPQEGGDESWNRSHHASLRTQKIGTRYENVWLASFPWIHIVIPLLQSMLLLVWFHLKWWTHVTEWILGMDKLCHLKRAGLMDLLFYPSCYWPWQWRER